MSKFGFDKIAREMPAMKREALKLLSVETQQYFGESFSKQGLGNEKWAEVKRRTSPYSSMWDKTRPILYGKSGQLRAHTLDSIESINDHQFVLVNPMSYAVLQNEGGENGQGAYVPARPFMKQTQELTHMQLETLNAVTGKIWHLRF